MIFIGSPSRARRVWRRATSSLRLSCAPVPQALERAFRNVAGQNPTINPVTFLKRYSRCWRAGWAAQVRPPRVGVLLRRSSP